MMLQGQVPNTRLPIVKVNPAFTNITVKLLALINICSLQILELPCPCLQIGLPDDGQETVDGEVHPVFRFRSSTTIKQAISE